MSKSGHLKNYNNNNNYYILALKTCYISAKELLHIGVLTIAETINNYCYYYLLITVKVTFEGSR